MSMNDKQASQVFELIYSDSRIRTLYNFWAGDKAEASGWGYFLSEVAEHLRKAEAGVAITATDD